MYTEYWIVTKANTDLNRLNPIFTEFNITCKLFIMISGESKINMLTLLSVKFKRKILEKNINRNRLTKNAGIKNTIFRVRDRNNKAFNSFFLFIEINLGI